LQVRFLLVAPPSENQMASLRDNQRALVRMILMSTSGGGKTSSLIPLAIPRIIPDWPGRKLFVLNFDGKDKFSEIAKFQLDDRLARKGGIAPISKDQYEAAIDNIDWVDCGDPKAIARDAQGFHAQTVSADAWQLAKKTLNSWWPKLDKDSVLVLDSFTHYANAVANYTMALAGRLNKNAEGFKDYSPAQREIQAGYASMCAAPCDLIITAHQDGYKISKESETPERDPETGEMVFREQVVDVLMLPKSFGQAGRLEIPSTFNHLLYLTTNKNQQREIRLQPGKGIMPKTPFFARAEKSYGIDTGLVKYWALGEPT
jgi:hypothetical protein